MAKVFDLSSILEEKKSVIKLDGKEYEINEGFNDLLKIDALSSQKDTLETTDFIKEFLIITLGAEAAEELIAKNYKFSVYVKIMNCIEEVYSGDAEKEESTAPTLV